MTRFRVVSALALAGFFASATPAFADPIPTRAVTVPPAPRLSDADVDAHMAHPSFDEAVKQSLAKNPTAAIARLEIRRAGALLEEARSTSLPILNGNFAYTRLDGDRVIAGTTAGAAPNVISAANQISANLTLAVPLIAPRSWLQWSHAREQVDVSRLSAADVLRQLALGTGRAYLTIVAAKRVIAVTHVARDNARVHYDFAHARYVGGVGNRIDEVRAAQELATDESQLQSAVAALARAREALGVLTGSDGPVDSAVEPDLETERGASGLDRALDDSGRLRADVRAAEGRLDAAHKVTRDSWADYAPLVLGVFQPFVQDPPLLTVPRAGWQAQIVLSLPLYDGGLRYGLRRERKSLEDEARATVEAALRQARAEVRAAFESVRRADESLFAARDAARLTHEGLELAQLAYHSGATTNIEVIDAERSARDADTAVAVSEDAARQARLDLLAASGRFP